MRQGVGEAGESRGASPTGHEEEPGKRSSGDDAKAGMEGGALSPVTAQEEKHFQAMVIGGLDEVPPSMDRLKSCRLANTGAPP